MLKPSVSSLYYGICSKKDIRRCHVERRNLNAFIVYVPEYSGSSLLMQIIKGEDNLDTWLGPFCQAHENSQVGLITPLNMVDMLSLTKYVQQYKTKGGWITTTHTYPHFITLYVFD